MVSGLQYYAAVNLASRPNAAEEASQSATMEFTTYLYIQKSLNSGSCFSRLILMAAALFDPFPLSGIILTSRSV